MKKHVFMSFVFCLGLISGLKSEQENIVLELTMENFDSVISSAKKPVVVDFYATWCQPCKKVKPIFAELVQEEDWIFGAIDIDKISPSLMVRYGVRVLPTFVVFKGGVKWGMMSGMLKKEELKKELTNIINAKSPIINPEDYMQQLFMAINQHNIDEIKKNIANGADVNGVLKTPEGNLSALQVAIIAGTQDIIDVLICSGAKMDASVKQAVKEYLALYEKTVESIEKNFEYAKKRMVNVSLPANYTPTKGDSEFSSKIMMALGDSERMKQLVKSGIDVNTIFAIDWSTDKTEVTPIYLALFCNDRVAIDILIDAGASFAVEITDGSGTKKTVERAIQYEIEQLRLGIKQGHERFNYALSKIQPS